MDATSGAELGVTIKVLTRHCASGPGLPWITLGSLATFQASGLHHVQLACLILSANLVRQLIEP